MCGVAGILSPQRAIAPGTIETMAKALRHRGPDDVGHWQDEGGHIALGHTRLSIIDLTTAGSQPMVSRSDRYVVTFNGEIYNHQDLRDLLDGQVPGARWRGHSDTETLLAGFDRWGIVETLKRATGMFALGVWDRQKESLTLARDRFGEKPLHYGWVDGAFVFGSELKALTRHPKFRAPINRGALSLLVQHGYIPAPYTIYEGISKLLPGCTLTVSAKDGRTACSRYWDASSIIQTARGNPFAGTESEALDQLEKLLRLAVKRQMLSDVPLGAFLSGGIDSSTVVALMQCQSTQPVMTFSIGFNEAAYNEATHAAAVAKHLGTNHTELYVTADEALAVIPRLPTLYDEPFADSSQIPTFLVSQLARNHVTVALSGDGGDELFGGYNRYLITDRMWAQISRLPFWLRRRIARSLVSLPPALWDRAISPFRALLPRFLSGPNVGAKLHKGASLLELKDGRQLYHQIVSHWPTNLDLVVDAPKLHTVLTEYDGDCTGHLIEEMMALDVLTYLPDDILCKVDRAAMGVSLETRVPLLDHSIAEFVWSLPINFKIRRDSSKWILRQVLHRHVPKGLVERPKMGFGVPIDHWLRGPLRDWAEDLLSEDRLRRDRFLVPGPIREKWQEHLSGRRDWQYPLWNILMFQAWLHGRSAS